MSFDSSLESINKLTKFGMELASTDISYSDYQTEMIEKFYADADIEIINQMTEWAFQPLMKLITVDVLKQMVLKAMKKQFKKRADEIPPPQSEIDQYYKIISDLPNAISIDVEYGYAHIQEPYKRQYILHKDNAHDWATFIKMNDSQIYFNNQYGGYRCSSIYVNHATFVNNMYSVWVTVHSKKINLNVNNLLVNQNILLRKVADLQSEVNQLKQKNANLSYQVQLTTYSLQVLQPVSPVYDYKEIKARKQILHSEFKRLSKLMRLG
jgi:hypothetical protein